MVVAMAVGSRRCLQGGELPQKEKRSEKRDAGSFGFFLFFSAMDWLRSEDRSGTLPASGLAANHETHEAHECLRLGGVRTVLWGELPQE